MALAATVAAFLTGPGAIPDARAGEDHDRTVLVVAGWEESLSRHEAVERIEAAATRFGGGIDRVDPSLAFAVVEVPESRVGETLDALRGTGGIEHAERDQPVNLHYSPNDPLYAYQWGPPAIGMPAAWDAGRGSHQIRVGIIDTGVDADHPDLAPNVCDPGANFVDPGQPPGDTHSHGTHVAGTVGAAIGNGQGVAGMANVCIVPIKVIDGHGRGSTVTLAEGIRWAADNDVDVVNMSLGGPSGTFYEEAAIQYAWDRGVLLVSSAGNDSCAPVGYPAAYPEVMATAALAFSTSRASYSNCGPELELSAPGSDIASTDLAGTYSLKSGTSMASPHVAGVAALLWNHDSTLSNAQLRCLLHDTADDLGDPGKDPYYGWGRVDADGAIDRIAAGPVPAWPNCGASPPAGDTREVESTYIAGNDTVVHCLSRVGGACFDVEEGDETVSIVLDDIFVEPVPGYYRFRDAVGNDVGSGAFCATTEHRAVPAGATTLYVYAGGPLRATLECGAPSRMSTLGFIRVTFNG